MFRPVRAAIVAVVVAAFLLALAPPRLSAGVSILPPADANRFAEAERQIDAAIAQGKLPGAVLVVGRRDGIVYHKAFGNRAVRPATQPMTEDSIFDLASLSKSIGCASSIMVLIERGKLHLDDKVAKYLPGFAANGKQDITVEQLLLHRAGFVPDNDIRDYKNGPADAMKKVFALAPHWPPGTHFAYSDVGFIVLGELVKAVDGRPLDQFAREEVFAPLAMTDTGYNPPASWKSRCAPTEQRDGHWMIGEVHDPRAYALGGVAGHAGVFSTADNVARYCRMVLGGGILDGTRVLKESTIRNMAVPRCLPDSTGCRGYGWDIDTPYSSCRGERFAVGTTFGHTGFTGTMYWIDPAHDCFFVLLTNSVHLPGGKVLDLRRRVATAVGEAMLGPALFSPSTTQPVAKIEPVLCGIDVLKAEGFKSLEGRRIVLVTNQTGLDREGNRTVDLLAGAKNCSLVRIFSPEHGLFGLVDEKVADTTEPKTGLKVFSLYGALRKPTPAMLEGLDTIVFDIQDAGVRYYTYESTMGLCMEAAAAQKIRMVVLDRPNPVTGRMVDGPLADEKDLGFTSYAPIPIAHGMTLGELANYFNKERGIGCNLIVVPMKNWRRDMWFDETRLTWTNPSPNLRNPTEALLYLAIGQIEAANISVGRGTDTPFEVIGAPWIDGPKLAAALNAAKVPGLRFTPMVFTPSSSKFSGKSCFGVHIAVTDRMAAEPVRAGAVIAWHLHHMFGKSFALEDVNKLVKSDRTINVMKKATSPWEIPVSWAAPLEGFRSVREKYLLYQ